MAFRDPTPCRPHLFAALTSPLAILLMHGCVPNHNSTTVTILSPTRMDDRAIDLPGLHNVVTYADQLVCGGVPDGEQGFDTLDQIGIKTIISVDGAKPDLKRAGALGLRYVHLPISYDTVSAERQVELAQAISNLQRPIYVHCHHGKHRSGAALATALIGAGQLTVEQATERMHVSGTAASYSGLWDAVQRSRPLREPQLQRDPSSFPSITTVTGLVATMSELDEVLDRVRQSQRAGWRAPDDHPDLVAEKEAGRLAELLSSLRNDVESQRYPPDYQRHAASSIQAGRALHAAVRDADVQRASQMLTTLTNSCKACHRTYRNK